MPKTVAYLPPERCKRTWYGNNYYEVDIELDIPEEGWDVTFQLPRKNSRLQKGKLMKSTPSSHFVYEDDQHNYFRQKQQYVFQGKTTHHINRSFQFKDIKIFHNGNRVILTQMYKVDGDKHVPCKYVDDRWMCDDEFVFLGIKKAN